MDRSVAARLACIIIFPILFWIVLWKIETEPVVSQRGLYQNWYEGIDESPPETMSDKRIVIAFLARDIEPQVQSLIQRSELIGNLFSDYRIISVENDSSDKTRQLLKNWSAKNSKVTLMDCCEEGSCECVLSTSKGYNSGIISEDRIKRMAKYRNKYLHHALGNYSDYDYLFVMDSDLGGSFEVNEFLDIIQTAPEWDAIFVNGQVPFPGSFGTLPFVYDAVAYTPVDSPFLKLNQSTGALVPLLIKKFVELNSTSFLGSESLIPVSSAFGGMGIYKMSSLKNKDYSGEFACEHTNLASDLIQDNKKLFIGRNWKGHFDMQGPNGPYEYFKSLVRSYTR